MNTDTKNLPTGWERDTYWRTAMHLLAAFGDDTRIWAHVDTYGIRFADILADGTWSSGERRIIQAAASLWDDTPVSLLELAAGLDDDHWQLVLDAMRMHREGLR